MAQHNLGRGGAWGGRRGANVTNCEIFYLSVVLQVVVVLLVVGGLAGAVGTVGTVPTVGTVRMVDLAGASVITVVRGRGVHIIIDEIGSQIDSRKLSETDIFVIWSTIWYCFCSFLMKDVFN